jgi:hypothetical protein
LLQLNASEILIVDWFCEMYFLANFLSWRLLDNDPENISFYISSLMGVKVNVNRLPTAQKHRQCYRAQDTVKTLLNNG